MKLLADQPWARVLYTTRLAPDDFTQAGARIRPLDLDRLPENQAVNLIRRYQPGQAFASPEHETAAREIVRELSGLTLAAEKTNTVVAFELLLRELNRRERCLLILDNVAPAIWGHMRRGIYPIQTEEIKIFFVRAGTEMIYTYHAPRIEFT
jgi:hypothetical protein